MTDKNRLVILAAGKGTRLKTEEPKPLVRLRDLALIDYVLETVKGIGSISIVVGYKSNEVMNYLDQKYSANNFEYILQEEQLGTGHAVMTYFEKSKNALAFENTFVLCADTPLLKSETFRKLESAIVAKNAVCAVFESQDPKGYGRILKHDVGFSIREEKDASAEERTIKIVNSGLYVFKTQYLFNQVKSLNTNNESGEFYLTDSFKEGMNVETINFDDKKQFLGINNLYQLSQAEGYIRGEVHNYLMIEKGVKIIDPSHTYIYTKNIGEGSVINPNTLVDESSVIGSNVEVEMGSIIKNSTIGDFSTIKANSYIESSIIGEKCKIGPMAQLRPYCEIGNNVKIGNFVELKKVNIRDNTSISHLSYLGDAVVGRDVNIGCGFITCNYDGANKHITEIGDRAFIGSDCQVIAPIKIEEDAYIGSGSTINRSVPRGAFAIARGRQVTKEDMAKKFMKTKKK